MDAVISEVKISLLRPLGYLKGLWKSHGPSFFKSSSKGFSGFGVKAILKDRPQNTFEFIAPNTERDTKMFKNV